MATSVIAGWLQDALLTFSFHSYNHYGNACYSLKSARDYSGYLNISYCTSYTWL